MSRASRLEVASPRSDRRPQGQSPPQAALAALSGRGLRGPAAPHRRGPLLLLRHPVAGDRDAPARGSRTIVAADLRPSARAAGRSVPDRGRADRAAQRSRLRRPAPGHRGRTVRRRRERHRAVDSRREAGRHGDPGRVRSGRGQAGHAGDRDDPPHRAGRRRHVHRPRHARAAAPHRARHRRPREAAQGAAVADSQARARRRCSPSRTAGSTTIPAST